MRDRSHHIAVPAIIAKIEVNSEYYFITNTHLAVTANGEAANYQIKQAENLLSLLGSFSDMIVCGDLNAPRGGEVFNLFKNVYQDNIPAEYETSLDQSLHRVKGLKFVVDHILSTKNYSFTNVVLVDGVSDHMAVVGEVASLNKDILSRLRNLLGYYS